MGHCVRTLSTVHHNDHTRSISFHDEECTSRQRCHVLHRFLNWSYDEDTAGTTVHYIQSDYCGVKEFRMFVDLVFQGGYEYTIHHNGVSNPRYCYLLYEVLLQWFQPHQLCVIIMSSQCVHVYLFFSSSLLKLSTEAHGKLYYFLIFWLFFNWWTARKPIDISRSHRAKK